MEERLQFVRDALSDRFTMSELCARYGVSRRVGYKWLARYDTDGRRGLVDRSRAPHHCRTRSPMRWPSCSSARARRIPSGARASSCACWLRSIHAFTTGRRRAPSRISSPPVAWCRSAGIAAPRRIPAWSVPRRRRPTTYGPQTSKVSFAPAIGATAIRSPSQISTRAFSSRVVAYSPRRPSRPAPSSSGPSASTGCRSRSAPTTACPSRRKRFTGFRT
jgi:transposase-like protein